jgi:hypothetical protein
MVKYLSFHDSSFALRYFLIMARPQYDRTLDYKLFALLVSFPSFTDNFIAWNSSIGPL